MCDSALALSTFVNLKPDLENCLPNKPSSENDFLNALLLNEKQTDESYQIFIPSNNIKFKISPVSY